MTEITTEEAGRLLGLSRDRVSQMLRSGGLAGRKLGPHLWVVDLSSVHDRKRLETASGRPWSAQTAGAVIAALSDGVEVDTRTSRLIAATSGDTLWRKIAQQVVIRRYRSRRLERALPYLALTGASALDRLGERLTGESRITEGYLRDIDLDELTDIADLVPDSEGRLAVHETAFLTKERTHAAEIPVALVAADCARSTVSRVNRVGVRELERMRERWLQTSI